MNFMAVKRPPLPDPLLPRRRARKAVRVRGLWSRFIRAELVGMADSCVCSVVGALQGDDWLRITGEGDLRGAKRFAVKRVVAQQVGLKVVETVNRHLRSCCHVDFREQSFCPDISNGESLGYWTARFASIGFTIAQNQLLALQHSILSIGVQISNKATTFGG